MLVRAHERRRKQRKNEMKNVTKKKAAKAAKTPAKKTAKPAANAAKSAEPKPGTKTAKVIAMLERKGGATAPELLKATGWQAHSRGAHPSTAPLPKRAATGPRSSSGPSTTPPRHRRRADRRHCGSVTYGAKELSWAWSC
jgi:Protein of unknown function (DUF3489)